MNNELEAWIPQVLCTVEVYSSNIIQKVPVENIWKQLNFGLPSERGHQQLSSAEKLVLTVLCISKYSAFLDARLVCPGYMDMVKLFIQICKQKKFSPAFRLENIFATLIVKKKKK